MGEINLSEKQSDAWHYLEDDTTTEVLFGGAAGPGKTYFGCVWHINRRMKYPKSRGLIGRAKLKILEESTLVTFFQAAADMGYLSGVHFTYNQQKNFILWHNGSKTILKDLFRYPSDPDFKSLGSTEYTDAFIDEATEISLKAFEIVNSRIRWKMQEYGLIPKILLTCNPGPGWIKEKFVLTKENQPVKLQPYQKFVAALVTDNPNPAFRDLYIQQLSRMTSEYDKQRLLYGDWDAQPDNKSPFAPSYNKDKHESNEAKYNPDMRVIFIFDFNLNPFAVNMAHMWRDEYGEHIHIFDELSMESGSIPRTCEIIRTKYLRSLPGCQVTGDATSQKGDISQVDNASHYMQIQRLLKLKPHQFKLPKANPTHQNSKQDVNYLLEHFPDFKINPVMCPNTCRDLKIVQVDAFDSIIKRNRSDISQLSDHLDNVRYLVNTFCKAWILNHQKRS